MPAQSALRALVTPTPAGTGARSRLKGLTSFHVFMLGWSYYIAIPLFAGLLGLFETLEAAEPAARYFETQSEWWSSLVAYALLMPAAFLVGDRLARLLRRNSAIAVRIGLANWILLPLYGALLLAFIVAARELLFAGYADGVDSSLVGPIATVQMVLTFQFLLCTAAGAARARLACGLLLGVSSVALLGMGGRLYVTSTLVALYFYWWNWGARDDAARRRSVKWALMSPFVLAAVGMWRVGSLDVSSLGFYLFAEPLFTSISGMSFMLNGKWSLLTLPTDFFSAFTNIIPTALWPTKADELVALGDILDYESPFGALSIITSSVGNFGFVGGLGFIGFVGCFMGRARRNARTPLTRAFYCFLVALLPFMFFRDPFQVQIKLVVTGVALMLLHRVISAFAAEGANVARSKPALR